MAALAGVPFGLVIGEAADSKGTCAGIGGNDVRIAMIAYALYPLDPRVARAAEALAESGHEVDVFAISLDGTKAGSGSGSIRVRLLPIRQKRAGLSRYFFEYGVFLSWAFAQVTLLHARRKYRVVYVHNMPNFLVFAGLFPKISRAKVVLDVHDPAAELMADIRGRDLPPWARRFANAEERLSISFSDTVITVNESMRRRLSAMSSRPVSVVMNIPDTRHFVPQAASRDEGGAQWIVYAGSIAYRNGVDLVVRAVALLADEFPLLRFRVVGEGPALESVARLAEDLGVTDRVEFRGLVPNEEIPAVLSDASAGISSQRGGAFGSLVFSMKVAEYVALGVPVICAATATMRHYFSGDDLLFFEPENPADLARAIRAHLANPAAAAERAASSQAKLAELGWPVQKETLVGTVEALASSQEKDNQEKDKETTKYA